MSRRTASTPNETVSVRMLGDSFGRRAGDVVAVPAEVAEHLVTNGHAAIATNLTKENNVEQA